MRSDKIKGYTQNAPQVGRQFFMQALPHDPELREKLALRLVNTSEIVHIKEKDGSFLCTTESGSIYLIEVDNTSGDSDE